MFSAFETVRSGVADAAGAARGRVGASADAGRVTVASGITSSTAGLAASRCSSSADIVAETALTSVNCLTLVAWTWFSWLSSDVWLADTAADLALLAAVPAAAAPNWSFSTTMTGWSTFCDSCAASVGDSGPKAGALVALAPPAVAAITTAGTPPSTAAAAADTARTGKNLGFGMSLVPDKAALIGRNPCDANRNRKRRSG